MGGSESWPVSPFQRLRGLLVGIESPREVLDYAIGNPEQPPPARLLGGLTEAEGWGRYPDSRSEEDLQAAVCHWLQGRYGITWERQNILALSGSKEGLFLMILHALNRARGRSWERRPGVVMSNPHYHVYRSATLACGGEVLAVPAHAEGGPDAERCEGQTIAAVVVCNPDNPTGRCVSRARLEALLRFARRHEAVVIFDECYSELWTDTPPVSALEVLAEHPEPAAVVFNSLSKRSGATGLRVGFVAGLELESFAQMRAFSAAVPPAPLQTAAAALWRDEEHVQAHQKVHHQRLALAAQYLGDKSGFRLPEGGFFLWLKVGDGEDFARRLYAEHGVRVMPGAYMASEAENGNPGRAFIRLALVGGLPPLEEALDAMKRSW